MKNLRIQKNDDLGIVSYLVKRDYTEQEIKNLEECNIKVTEEMRESGFLVASFTILKDAEFYLKIQNRLPYTTLERTKIVSDENLKTLRNWGALALCETGGILKEMELFTSICKEINIPPKVSPVDTARNHDKLLRQLFQGKVSDVIGFEKTMQILREANEALKITLP